jgi:hypothetical protein
VQIVPPILAIVVELALLGCARDRCRAGRRSYVNRTAEAGDRFAFGGRKQVGSINLGTDEYITVDLRADGSVPSRIMRSTIDYASK